jgi:hypothetical protein
VLFRSVRRLEKKAPPLLYAQVGALRYQLTEMRAAQDRETRWQRRRLREVEEMTARAEAELQMLAQSLDQLSHAMLHGLTQLEERFGNTLAAPRRAGARARGKPDIHSA